MKTNLEWLRTFKAIYELGTMSDAAKELNISQPGVSLHLNSLEAYVGHPLFERGTRKMIPNERAKLLYIEILSSISKLEEVENTFRNKSEKRKLTVSIGMYPGLFRQLLEPHIPNLDFNLILHLENNDKMRPLLENGSVDMIITTDHLPCKNTIYEVLGKSQFIHVAGKNTNISDFQTLNFENKKQISRWLQSQIWYTTSDREKFIKFWKLNFKRDPDFAPNYTVPDKFSILRCLSNGDGIAVLPASICHDAITTGDIKFLWKGYVDMKNTLYFGQRKKSLLHDELLHLKEIIIPEFEKSHPEIY